MYLAEVAASGFRLFGTDDAALVLPLKPSLNVLVGENDAGKTAVVDAIRLALGTTSQEFQRVVDEDFHVEEGTRAKEFAIRCRFVDIDMPTGGGFLEHLSYENGKPCLYVTFRATRNEVAGVRRRITVDVRSGRDGKGPQLDGNTRLFLQTTYLRPLRDAERELAAGRNSRLSQILQHTKEIAEHLDEEFDPAAFVKAVLAREEVAFPKNVAHVSSLADHLIQENEGVKEAGDRLDSNYLANLNLGDEPFSSRVSVGGETTADQRLRAVLEKLDLRLSTAADTDGQLPHGLGYNNLLFMACELLLLGQDEDTLPLLLIEEPEAHLHPQLQLRLVEFLQGHAAEAVGRPVQVIITTHSPNLASKVKLASMILMCQGQAFPLGPEHTQLSATDYRFLERFLDVTKANLFFARGVLIVEGDAEALLIPTLARLLGRDLTRHGVSVVNVGSRGLRRWARIFRRNPFAEGGAGPPIPIRVACLADRDIMPDCATEALELDTGKEHKGGTRFESDLRDDAAREKWRQDRCKDDGEEVRTFVSEHWTLEYDLAYAGLGCCLWKAIALAREEARQDRQGAGASPRTRAEALTAADDSWHQTRTIASTRSDGREFLAWQVYAPLRDKVSKPMAAQHMASLLEGPCGAGGTPDECGAFPACVPGYIRDAVNYVTGADKAGKPAPAPPAAGGEAKK